MFPHKLFYTLTAKQKQWYKIILQFYIIIYYESIITTLQKVGPAEKFRKLALNIAP